MHNRAPFNRRTLLIDVAPPAVFPQRFYCLGIYVSRTYCFSPSGVIAQKWADIPVSENPKHGREKALRRPLRAYTHRGRIECAVSLWSTPLKLKVSPFLDNKLKFGSELYAEGGKLWQTWKINGLLVCSGPHTFCYMQTVTNLIQLFFAVKIYD